MGLFDTVEVSVDLPGFPEGVERPLSWQSKSIDHPCQNRYRITADGRLELHRRQYRDRTEAEKQEWAEEHDFSSWDEAEEWVEAHRDEHDFGAILDRLDNWWLEPQVLESKYWSDVDYHGTFKFYTSGKGHEGMPDDDWLEYEARFTEGELVDVVRLDERS